MVKIAAGALYVFQAFWWLVVGFAMTKEGSDGKILAHFLIASALLGAAIALTVIKQEE